MTTVVAQTSRFALAQQRRVEAARQRRELIGAPPRVLVPALVDPTVELGTYRLCRLFAPSSRRQTLIYRFGLTALQRVLAEIREQDPHGQRWHTEARLDELSRRERQLLARAVVKHAPRKWREAA